VVAWMVHMETAGPVEGLTEDAIDDLVDSLSDQGPSPGVRSWAFGCFRRRYVS